MEMQQVRRPSSVNIGQWLDKIRSGASEHPERFAGVEGTFQFILQGEQGGAFYARLADGKAEIEEGRVDNPSVTVTLAADDFEALLEGKLNPVGAFMSGRLKLQGDIGLAMRLQNLLG